jgi:hypothetical protein
MIEAPHTLHTHRRSSSYIYTELQHLLPWLAVKWMQHCTDICWVSWSQFTVVAVGECVGLTFVACVRLWLRCQRPNMSSYESPTAATTVRPSIWDWGCILMTICYSRRCWNTIYMYVNGLSMKWLGCLNHNMQHEPSEKPSESPTSALPLSEGIY